MICNPSGSWCHAPEVFDHLEIEVFDKDWDKGDDPLGKYKWSSNQGGLIAVRENLQHPVDGTFTAGSLLLTISPGTPPTTMTTTTTGGANESVHEPVNKSCAEKCKAVVEEKITCLEQCTCEEQSDAAVCDELMVEKENQYFSDFTPKGLTIKIISANGLLDMDEGPEESDPYVFVKSGHEEICRTPIVKDDLQPKWFMVPRSRGV